MHPPSLLLPLPLLLLLVMLGASDVAWVKGCDEHVQAALSQIMRQLMLQQLYVEEAARSAWDSGIKQVRRRTDGIKSYHTETYGGRSVASIHDHSNNIRTVGMGEFVGILNGVEFRTRHNDYRLKKPSTTSGAYHEVEDIAFPDVPPEVLSKATVDEQVTEMREWFRAWQNQNHSERDYRPYFKALMCYLEGAWSTDQTLEEPFSSDRHHLEAESWFELQEQIRFTSSTGSKNFDENFSYLPTTLMSLTNDSVPIFGQWNYRILCHPLNGDLPLSYYKPVDSLSNRLLRDQTYAQHLAKRNVRFRLESPKDNHTWSVLDTLMQQVPGKDNYMANLTDNIFGQTKIHVLTNLPLNTGMYNRVYKVNKKDAMGEKNIFRGYADRNLFVAQTTQPRVAEATVPYCKKTWKGRVCETLSQRVSYAVPLEIVYMTPLQRWNPYGLVYKGEHDSPEGSAVEDGGRDGKSAETAYNGSHSKLYFRTPSQFYTGDEVDTDSADTTRGGVWVLDENGEAHLMTSSGVRIQLPDIAGVGVVRTRWPIMPLAVEGHPAWKELEALRDLVTDMERHLRYYPTPPPFSDAVLQSAFYRSSVLKVLFVAPSLPVPLPQHQHLVELSREEFKAMKLNNETLVLYTKREERLSHAHELVVDFDEDRRKFTILKCDKMDECFDGHPLLLTWGAPPS